MPIETLVNILQNLSKYSPLDDGTMEYDNSNSEFAYLSLFDILSAFNLTIDKHGKISVKGN